MRVEHVGRRLLAADVRGQVREHASR